ncbi:Fe-S cluster assembly ATPase SufC [Weissella paramesenteroides]|uniref:Fe-S cluster assembly ATPase SufC n=1 Tax=Weissella paramesenteroides TaxID=1249 RepID=A0ABD4XG36_WEIPA|nr:Fe-S cluster assembly ATPase SufC [Weissella paramesenteroides]MDF8366364.1 Fe-S cluster assembly ATPase SufC [Weissella paramesenteroides]MDF8368238.1 Fe-S cluster assembly ATPase SufC [Weissella paramesenteroides]MDF8370254.1 Fe-S cluster assembly ATPase SufC [Weissella paramesenteroides]MDF8373111.1 Fe-S cluster assembly ATPase SufC [Weissella paramesenteroides]WIG67083.1 Fe-S cluster assembly ATPase SufC [Weissella paramesenteroides]
MAELIIDHLSVAVQDKTILNDVNLTIKNGEIHALMGPNGTGKSTLSETIMGNPRYQITGGRILLDGQNITEMATDERARAGIFLAMQYPVEVAGITNADFIHSAMNARNHHDAVPVLKFLNALHQNMAFLDMDEDYADRGLNEDFSGGEKKRNEILQLMMLQPTMAVLDEIDSGLDIDALKVVARGINKMRSESFSCLMVTHYQRLLNYVVPDVVHVMMGGHIIKTGGPELALALEKNGYEGLDQV